MSVGTLAGTTLREAAWAIVKDAQGMTDTGHAAAVRWARALLGLDDPGTPDVPARRRLGPHVHGWARVDGVWACVQDYYAAGAAPGTGCGETWDGADQTSGPSAAWGVSAAATTDMEGADVRRHDDHAGGGRQPADLDGRDGVEDEVREPGRVVSVHMSCTPVHCVHSPYEPPRALKSVCTVPCTRS
jgi:hypothetical protein